MRVDDKTRWTSVELLNGVVHESNGKPFRIARLVGDLGYAGGMVVTDGKRSYPLTSVAFLSGQTSTTKSPRRAL